jgi:hypothetical protein
MKAAVGDPLALGIYDAALAFEARHRRERRGIAQALGNGFEPIDPE